MSMTSRFVPAVLAMSLGVSACGLGSGDVETPSATPQGSTTTLAESSSDETTATPDTTAPASSSTSSSTSTEATTEAAPTSSEVSYLVSAIDATAAFDSGRFRLDYRVMGLVEGVAVDAPIVIETSQAANGDFSGSADLGAFLQAAIAAESEELDEADLAAFEALSSPSEIVIVGDTGYSRGGLGATFFGVDPETWIETSAFEAIDENDGQSLIQTGQESLAAIRDAGGTIEELGDEDLDGVATTRYRAQIQPQAIVDADLGPVLGDDGLEAEASGMAPIDLWIDGDDVLRRFQIVVDGSQIEEADPEEGSEIEMLEITGEWSDLGEVAEIDVPTGEILTAEEAFGEGGLFGELLEGFEEEFSDLGEDLSEEFSEEFSDDLVEDGDN